MDDDTASEQPFELLKHFDPRLWVGIRNILGARGSMAMPADVLPSISDLDYSIMGVRETSIVKVDALRPCSLMAPTRVVDVITKSGDPFSQ